MSTIQAPGLSVCMIVKNEQAVLGRCLRSIREAADQIVVVDTGSDDDTKAIAKEYGAEVHDFAWTNDFAAARNRSLDYAKHAWILWVDADDVLPRQSIGGLNYLKSKKTDRILGFIVRNQKPGNTGSEFMQARMFPNNQSIRFEGRIHEQIMPSALRLGMKMEKTSVVIEHHGYADPQQLKSKARRNLEFLLNDYNPNDPDPVSLIEIADSYTILEDDESASHWYRLFLDMPQSRDKTPFLATQALMGLGNRANSKGEYKQARGFFEQALSIYPDRPDVLYGLAVSFEMMGQIDKAVQTLYRIPDIRSMPVQVGVDFRLTTIKAYLRLFRILGHRRDYQSLRELIVEALDRAGERPDIKNAAGTAYFQLGNLMEALHAFEESLKTVQIGNIEAYIGLCAIYSKAGKTELVNQTLESIQPLFERNSRYWAARILFTGLGYDDIPKDISSDLLDEEVKSLQETYYLR